MDRRIEKTKNSIINAFLELRSKKDIEKISIRELCERANINKSTFYTHYRDIYDLSEQLESQVVQDILAQIDHADCIITDPQVFTQELYYAWLAHEHLIGILFSGSRRDRLIVNIESSIKDKVYGLYPMLRENAFADTVFTLEIYGEFYAFTKCRRFGDENVIKILCAHWEANARLLKDQQDLI